MNGAGGAMREGITGKNVPNCVRVWKISRHRERLRLGPPNPPPHTFQTNLFSRLQPQNSPLNNSLRKIKEIFGVEVGRTT